jgi:hypothetical protein
MSFFFFFSFYFDINKSTDVSKFTDSLERKLIVFDFDID